MQAPRSATKWWFKRVVAKMKRGATKHLWQHHRAFLLNTQGFWNHEIHLDDEFLNLFVQVYVDGRARMTIRDMYNIWRCIKKVRGVDGDIAELGVYKGGSARLILEATGPAKSVHLFDTFEGMPETDPSIDAIAAGTFADTSVAGVRDYLAAYENVAFHKGWFPESAKALQVSGQKFSFVHLDVDLYESTLSGLTFFWPLLSRNGVLLSHDYCWLNCRGVRKAFDEFFVNRPEQVIELWDNHALVIKQ